MGGARSTKKMKHKKERDMLQNKNEVWKNGSRINGAACFQSGFFKT